VTDRLIFAIERERGGVGGFKLANLKSIISLYQEILVKFEEQLLIFHVQYNRFLFHVKKKKILAQWNGFVSSSSRERCGHSND
jgi:hypothetical protein